MAAMSRGAGRNQQSNLELGAAEGKLYRRGKCST